MSWQHGTEALFDSDGEQENKEQGFTLKGEYDRGSTPPSNHASPSPDPPASPDSTNPTQKSNPVSAGYSRSSTSGNYTAESDTMSHKKDYDYSSSRSRSRSSGYTRSRSPSYSDSFDSEDSMQDSRRASPVRNKKTTRGRSNTTNSRFNSGSSKDSRTTYRTVRSSNYGASLTPRQPKKGAAKKKGGGGRSQSVSGIQESPRSKDVSKRMLSAKGHTISRLRNEVEEFRRKFEDAARQNKLMVQLQRRQEVALAKYEDKEEELPQLLRQHSAELENIRERLRRTQDREKDKDRRIRNKNEEINKLNDEVSRLRRLAEDKNLLDRDKLQRKVDKLQDALDEKEKRVEDLEKYSENLKKNERFGGDQWKGREKEYRGRIARLEDENRTLNLQLKEKEKELEVRNIYSNRLVKPPAKLNTSISPTPRRPLSETRANSNDDIGRKPPPGPTLKRSSSVEEKRKPDESPRESKPPPNPKKEKVEIEKVEEKTPKRELSEHEKILMDLDSGFKPQPPPKKEKNDDILIDLDENIKRRERQDEDRRKREKEEAERKKKKEMEEDARRQREEERRRKEEEERKRKEEEERKEKERRQKEEEDVASALVKSSTFVTDRSPSVPKTPTFDDNSEGEDDVPFFGSKPKVHHPSKIPQSTRTSGNVMAVNSVRDLHKYSSNARQNSGSLRGMDDDAERRRDEEDLAAQRRKQKEDAEKLLEERKKKDLLLAKMRELDGKPDSRGSKKEYKFTQPVENLHHGKPSHPDLVGSPTETRKKPASDTNAEFGGYAPSFGRRAGAGDKPPAKKGGFFDDDVADNEDIFAPKSKQNSNSSKLMSNLFGETKTDSSTSKSRNSLEGTVFSNSTKAKPVADSNVLPWEKKTPGNPFAFTPSHPNKSNGVTVNMPKSSFDDFDDDIEEVVL